MGAGAILVDLSAFPYGWPIEVEGGSSFAMQDGSSMGLMIAV